MRSFTVHPDVASALLLPITTHTLLSFPAPSRSALSSRRFPPHLIRALRLSSLPPCPAPRPRSADTRSCPTSTSPTTRMATAGGRLGGSSWPMPPSASPPTRPAPFASVRESRGRARDGEAGGKHKRKGNALSRRAARPLHEGAKQKSTAFVGGPPRQSQAPAGCDRSCSENRAWTTGASGPEADARSCSSRSLCFACLATFTLTTTSPACRGRDGEARLAARGRQPPRNATLGLSVGCAAWPACWPPPFGTRLTPSPSRSKF